METGDADRFVNAVDDNSETNLVASVSSYNSMSTTSPIDVTALSTATSRHNTLHNRSLNGGVSNPNYQGKLPNSLTVNQLTKCTLVIYLS